MNKPSEDDLIARVIDRLHRDHPDPKMREELYDGDRLSVYVGSLVRDVDDDAVVARVVEGVRAAKDRG